MGRNSRGCCWAGEKALPHLPRYLQAWIKRWREKGTSRDGLKGQNGHNAEAKPRTRHWQSCVEEALRAAVCTIPAWASVALAPLIPPAYLSICRGVVAFRVSATSQVNPLIHMFTSSSDVAVENKEQDMWRSETGMLRPQCPHRKPRHSCSRAGKFISNLNCSICCLL